jgi:hypothetical protein
MLNKLFLSSLLFITLSISSMERSVAMRVAGAASPLERLMKANNQSELEGILTDSYENFESDEQRVTLFNEFLTLDPLQDMTGFYYQKLKFLFAKLKSSLTSETLENTLSPEQTQSFAEQLRVLFKDAGKRGSSMDLLEAVYHSTIPVKKILDILKSLPNYAQRKSELFDQLSKKMKELGLDAIELGPTGPQDFIIPSTASALREEVPAQQFDQPELKARVELALIKTKIEALSAQLHDIQRKQSADQDGEQLSIAATGVPLLIEGAPSGLQRLAHLNETFQNESAQADSTLTALKELYNLVITQADTANKVLGEFNQSKVRLTYALQKISDLEEQLAHLKLLVGPLRTRPLDASNRDALIEQLKAQASALQKRLADQVLQSAYLIDEYLVLEFVLLGERKQSNAALDLLIEKLSEAEELVEELKKKQEQAVQGLQQELAQLKQKVSSLEQSLMEQLTQAINSRELSKVEQILAACPALVNLFNEDDNTPLMQAAEWWPYRERLWNSEELFKMILTVPGSNPMLTNKKGKTAFKLVTAEIGEKIKPSVIQIFADAHAIDRQTGSQLLIDVAQAGDEESVEALLAVPGIDVNAYKTFNEVPHWTALYIASAMGHLGVVRLLLRHPRILVDYITDGVGMSPLMIALAKNHHEIAGELISAGADVEALSKYKAKPIDFCTMHTIPTEKDLIGGLKGVQLLLTVPTLDLKSRNNSHTVRLKAIKDLLDLVKALPQNSQLSALIQQVELQINQRTEVN